MCVLCYIRNLYIMCMYRKCCLYCVLCELPLCCTLLWENWSKRVKIKKREVWGLRTHCGGGLMAHATYTVRLYTGSNSTFSCTLYTFTVNLYTGSNSTFSIFWTPTYGWHVTGNRWQVTFDCWNVTGDRWQVTGDRWQVASLSSI